MEEVGAPSPHPYFIHHHQQSLSGRFLDAPFTAKKRNLPQHQRLQNLDTNWNPNIWDWDSVNFVAKPSQTAELVKPLSVNEDGENLTTLNLGGNLYSGEETLSRPNKRLRSGCPSPEGRGSYPMCQVDDCRKDLSNAKDYHRRHKVCEMHSKTNNSLVKKQMQRFCQQCSRFHPLLEFDEGKRSCRRRLAGHNRRRRKTQTEDVASRVLLPESQENPANAKLDVLNLLTLLARLQGNNAERTTNGASIPDRDRVVQMLNNINSLPVPANTASRFPSTRGFDLNVSAQLPLEQPVNIINGSTPASSTTDSHVVLPTALVASSTDALTILSQRSSYGNYTDKTNLNSHDHGTGLDLQKEVIPIRSVGVACTNNFQSSREPFDSQVQGARANFPLQLSSDSPESRSSSKLEVSRKYFSDSSDPMEERSPLSSPPVVQKLFPLQSASKSMKRRNLSVSGEDNGMFVTSTPHGWSPSLELLKRSSGRAESSSVQNLTGQAGYTSSSGSDQSPSSSNSDVQNRTGRIIFKLFDKDPSSLPATLKTQIYNWLSNSPSEMESYIRPGCVVLSIYIAMPLTTWTQLQEELLRCVKSLVQDSISDFWRSGKFMVYMDNQLASHKNGKIHLCKSWRTSSTPELLSVSPLAVVSGQETSLVLRGRNLAIPGTKIHCTYMGKYLSKNIIWSTDTAHDDISIQTFDFPKGSTCIQGRCFIEVENGFKGDNFPVIISDSNICGELRLLESELDDSGRVDDIASKDQTRNFRQPKSREDALQFLNELGWLFQKKTLSKSDGLYFSLTRFRFLLVFSVERDWSALVKTLLDIFVESNTGEDGLSRESLETLDGIHLLSRAVKRKFVNMANLLIQYKLTCQLGSSRKYLFLPNKAGHGGLTPLHLAACTQDSENMVDALTNDPQEVGLTCWTSQMDENGQSPYAYASLRNNHNYNKLVARKLADLKCGQVSISVGDSISSEQSWRLDEQTNRPSSQSLQGPRSCARCSVVMTRHYKMPGAQGLLQRPYVHSMLAIAAVCVCVCLFLRGSPDIGRVAPFEWENVHFGTS